MKPLPHTYSLKMTAPVEGEIELRSEQAEALMVTAPPHFDGPDDRWSPESLLVASVASCYVLTFRAVARAMGISWSSMSAQVDGILDKPERSMCFTRFIIDVELELDGPADLAKVDRVLDKAKRACLVTNTLNCEIELKTKVTVPA